MVCVILGSMIVSLTTWPYVCVGRSQNVLVTEVCLGEAIKIQKGETKLIVGFNTLCGR